MKSILLASASIVAFAGAAAAEVTFGGNANLGYNDTVTLGTTGDNAGRMIDKNDGFYWDANLLVTFAQALNNGLTAKATFGLDINDEAGDNTAADRTPTTSSYILELASENSSLQFGDVEYAAISVWDTAGAVLSADGFSDQDNESVLRGNVNYNGVDARISYAVADEQGEEFDNLEQLSLGAKAAFGNFNLAVAYQEESEANVEVAPSTAFITNDDFNGDEIFGLTVGTTFGGANVVLSYADNATDGTDSIGVSVGYPVGPLALRGWVASNSDHDDLSYGVRAIYSADAYSVTANIESRGLNETDALAEGYSSDLRWNLEGSYKVGNGLTAYAGILGRDSFADDVYYVAGEMDLGNGAALLVSYADADNTNETYLDDDEVGARNYQNGLTAEVKFTF